jgi:pimeloyl-ACP methyl ester carboxylesterase
MDLRGHGLSDPPRGDHYAVSALAEDIGAVADGLGLQRFVLVGHSMGGSAAAAYAGSHPDRVAGLALVGTPGKAPAEEAQKIMASLDADYDAVMAAYWAKLMKDARLSVRPMLEADMRRVQRQAAKAMIDATFSYDPLPALAAYRGPVLIIDSAQSDGLGALHRQAPKLPRQVIDGTSHWPQLDEPDRFNRLLDDFLAGLR